jgi:class 3 adenylate cyclase
MDLPELANGDHCCLFFTSPQEQVRITAPFLHSGLRAGERCVFVGDDGEVEMIRAGLKDAGISVEQEARKGRLVMTSEREYLDGGRWSTEKMLGFLQQAYDGAMQDGFTALRAAGDVSWQVGPEQDYGQVVYYETLLDMFFIGKRMVGMCQYPRGKCPADVLGGILSTHKIAAIDAQVCPNPHYVPPDLLLEKNNEVRQRKRVEWMTSQLVRVNQAEAAQRSAVDQVVRAHEQLKRMEKVREAFGLFVTPEVVDHVLARPQETWRRGEKKLVTMLFADVRRFTPFADANTPETVVDVLNDILLRIVGPIQRHGGILNKFMGDGILALFGAPLELPDHARAAASAALEARDAIEELAAERRAQGLPPLHIGIGINTGEVVAGCVGTASRTEYSVIGHAANLTARLESAAGRGQILLGAETAKRLGPAFRRRPMGSLKLKGIATPVRVYELAPRPKKTRAS